MRELEVIELALAAASLRPLKATLARCVALLPLTAAGAPDYFCFSEAARAKGCLGFNIVIFQTGVKSPDYVHILGPLKKPLRQWP